MLLPAAAQAYVTVQSVSYTPSSVDVRNGSATVTLTTRLTSPVGVSRLDMMFENTSANTSNDSVYKAFVPRTSGTAQDGVYTHTFTIPHLAPPGQWRYLLYLTESGSSDYEVAHSGSGGLPPGSPGPLTVTGDSTAPVLQSITFSPLSVDTTAGNAAVTATARVTDDVGVDIAGGEYFSFFLNSQNGFLSQTGAVAFQRTSGTETDGIYQANLTIRQGSVAGLWKWDGRGFYDASGNGGALYGQSHGNQPAGSPGSLRVNVVPDTSITSGPTVTKLTTASFAFASDAADATFACDLDGGGYSSCTSAKQYTGLSEGNHTFSVRATDSAAHTDASPASRTVNVDLTAPTTTDDVPAARQRQSVRVTLTADDHAGGSGTAVIRYETGATPSTPTNSSPVYAAANKPTLHDGETIKYFATDRAGNAEAVKTSANVAAVDGIAPTTTDDVSSAYRTTALKVTLSAADNTGGFGLDRTFYEVGVSPATPTTASSVYDPANKPTLQDGERIAYFSMDLGGNTEAVRTSSTAHVDAIAPITTDDVPSAPSLGGVAVTLSSTDNAGGSGVDKTYYEIGAPPSAPTTSSSVYDATDKPVLQDGQRIAYFSTDAVGNSETPRTSANAAHVDGVAPTVTLIRPADGASYDRHEVVTAMYACADDAPGSGLASCTGTVPDGAELDTSTIGDHSFSVTAVDAAGNSTTRSVTYTVRDVTRPTVVISIPAEEAEYDRHATVPAAYSCSDESGGSGVATCAGDLAIGEPIDTSVAGPHTFAVTATDGAGNTQTETVRYRVRDRTEPTLELTVPEAEGSYGRGRTVLADYACADEAGGAGLTACKGDVADGAALDTNTLGAHSFTVTATDGDGNTRTRTVTYRVRDVTRPIVTISGPDDDASFPQGSDAGEVRYACVDEAGGSGLESCTGSQPDGTPIDTSRIGRFAVTVEAEDTAGNATSVTVPYTVRDVTRPIVTISGPEDDASFPQGSDAGELRYACVDEAGGSGLESCTGSQPDGTPIDTSRLGRFAITVRAADAAGNGTSVTVAYTVRDVSPPSIDVTAPGPDVPSYELGLEVHPRFECTDDDAGSGVASCTASQTVLDTATPGLHHVLFTAVDRAGNIAQKVATYRVRHAPVRLLSLSRDTSAFRPHGRRAPAGAARASLVRYEVTRFASLALTYSRLNRDGSTAARFTRKRAALPGAGVFTFGGRRAGRPLQPGTWRLTVVATDDDGNSTPPRSVGFVLR